MSSWIQIEYTTLFPTWFFLVTRVVWRQNSTRLHPYVPTHPKYIPTDLYLSINFFICCAFLRPLCMLYFYFRWMNIDVLNCFFFCFVLRKRERERKSHSGHCRKRNEQKKLIQRHSRSPSHSIHKMRIKQKL